MSQVSRDVWYPLTEKVRYKIDGGNDKLPRAFSEKLKEKIHYGSCEIHIFQIKPSTEAMMPAASRLLASKACGATRNLKRRCKTV
jgi:monoamine oxidase